MSESTDMTSNKKKEIFTYDAPWTVYTMAWKRHPAGRFHLAIGSFMEEYINQVVLLRLDRDANDGDGDFVQLAKMDHPYPPTKIMFAPSAYKPSKPDQDLLASSGDYLRLWEVGDDNKMQLKALLNNSKHSGRTMYHLHVSLIEILAYVCVCVCVCVCACYQSVVVAYKHHHLVVYGEVSKWVVKQLL